MPKNLSNPFSTGGGGPNFETQIQASFATLMLAGGFSPCLDCVPISKIQLQGRIDGYHTDDLIIHASNEQKLLGQIKHSISLTNGSGLFEEVLDASWHDFCNSRLFKQDRDALALITGPLSATDIDNVRVILEWARSVKSAQKFIERITTAKFSSQDKIDKLNVFRHHLDKAKGSAVSDEELHGFLRHFHLLGYDLDLRQGVMHALMHSIIGSRSGVQPDAVFAQIVQEIAYINQNAGECTVADFPEAIRKAFESPATQVMPAALTAVLPPTTATHWNTAQYANSLAIACLAGSWNEGSQADIAVIRSLLDVDFNAWQADMRAVLKIDGSPLKMRDGVWTVQNRFDLWEKIGPSIFDAHVDRFARACLEVLREVDPALEMPKEDRFAALIHGKAIPHSGGMRKAFSETLALLGTKHSFLINCSREKAASTAAVVTRDLFEEADWRLWASLNYLLPSIAEAAPEQFLIALERDLQRTPSPFSTVFGQEGNGITGRSYMAGILWALESLCWHRDYLIRSVTCLGGLADIDPGGNWGNRPANSLTTLFLPWMPQTLAPTEKRRVAVKTLLREHPDAAWALLLSLLPNRVTSSSHTHKPNWLCDIPPNTGEGVSTREYWEESGFYSSLLIEAAAGSISRIQEVASHLDELRGPTFEKGLALMTSSAVTGASDDDRTAIWTALVDIVRKHRRFADAKWSMPADILANVERVTDELRPKSLHLQYRQLFCGKDWDLYERNGDWRQQEFMLAERRQRAIQEILASGGLEAAIAFSESVEAPGQVGYALGLIAEDHTDTSILPAMLTADTTQHRAFAAGYVLGRFKRGGWQWVDELLDRGWTPDQCTSLLITLPCTKEAWSRAEARIPNDGGAYWTQVQANVYQAQSDLDHAIKRFLQFGRPWTAIDGLSRQIREGQPIDVRMATQAMLDGLSGAERNRMQAYEATEVIKWLQSSQDADQKDLFKIEWNYLPLLTQDGNPEPRTLINTLLTTPSFFIELLSAVFRREDEPPRDSEPTEQERSIASSAYRLLDHWNIPPGVPFGEPFSPEGLAKWVAEALALAAERGRLTLAKQYIGKVLFHAPPDPSGIPIHEAAATILNDAQHEHIRRGYYLECLNSRGVVTIDPKAAPELTLAKEYRDKAEAVENAGFQRLASTMRDIAANYEREARRIQAEHATEAGEA